MSQIVHTEAGIDSYNWTGSDASHCFNRGGAPNTTKKYSRTWTDQLVESKGHPHQLLGKPGFRTVDIGGGFYVIKRNYSESSTLGGGRHDMVAPTSTYVGDTKACYKAFSGPQFARFSDITDSLFPAPGVSTDDVMKSLGRQAIARCAPTSPSYSVSAALGELSEGLPAIVGLAQTGPGRAATARQAGGEYLNVEFGWKPLLSDIRKFQKTVRDANKIITRYQKNSGKIQHVSYYFPSESSTEFSDQGYGFIPVPNFTNTWQYQGSKLGRLTTTTETNRKRWFKGCFVYHCPDIKSFHGKYSALDKVFGVSITPSTIWQLTPWSWAADWASDFGSLFKNLSSFGTDGLVMPYGYIMEETSVKKTYTLSEVYYDQRILPGAHTFTQSFETVSKRRMVGSPYGFDIDWPKFSQRQLAILTACGISRL